MLRQRVQNGTSELEVKDTSIKIIKALKCFRFSRVLFIQFLPLPERTSLIWAPTQMNACSKASYGADHYKYDWGGGGGGGGVQLARIFQKQVSFLAFFSFVPLCANCFVLPPSLFLMFHIYLIWFRP
jgi:hypothetical protein